MSKTRRDHKLIASKTAAKAIGVTVEKYLTMIANGQRWCSLGQHWWRAPHRKRGSVWCGRHERDYRAALLKQKEVRLEINIERCQRCGEDHNAMRFMPLVNAVDGFDHYGTCVNTKQPVLLAVVKDAHEVR